MYPKNTFAADHFIPINTTPGVIPGIVHFNSTPPDKVKVAKVCHP
jgi:hypothetical protein